MYFRELFRTAFSQLIPPDSVSFQLNQREGKRASSDAVVLSPPRLMAARKMMSDHVAQTAAVEFQGETAILFGTNIKAAT